MPYRNSLVRMYYAEITNKDTPMPFAELRVFAISENPTKFDFELIFNYELEKLEWIFSSLLISVLKRKIYYKIEGEERNEKIDKDEAIENFKTTQIEPIFNYPYRYARFIKKNLDIEYNEKAIRQIEKQRKTETTINTKKMDFIRYLEIKNYLGMLPTKLLAKFRYLHKKLK